METVLDSAVRHSLQLGSDWKIDRMLLDAEAQRIDIYVSHSGGPLICPKSGETGTLYDHVRSVLGDTWIGFSFDVLSTAGSLGSSLPQG